MTWAALLFVLLGLFMAARVAGLNKVMIRWAREEQDSLRVRAMRFSSAFLLSGLVLAFLGAALTSQFLVVTGFLLMPFTIVPPILYHRRARRNK